MSSTQLAPVVCPTVAGRPCGARIELVSETYDTVSHVYVGILRCVNGHRWIDIRSPRERRPHAGTAPAGQLSLFEG